MLYHEARKHAQRGRTSGRLVDQAGQESRPHGGTGAPYHLFGGRMATPAENLITALTEALNRTASQATTVTVTHTVTASVNSDLWSCHPEVRLSADQLAAALNCSTRSVYRLVAEKGMPARKRDEVLVFVAGAVREWLTDREEVVNRYLSRTAPRRAKA